MLVWWYVLIIKFWCVPLFLLFQIRMGIMFYNQMHHHGKIKRWLEDLWMWTVKFKDIVFTITVEVLRNCTCGFYQLVMTPSYINPAWLISVMGSFLMFLLCNQQARWYGAVHKFIHWIVWTLYGGIKVTW